MCPRDNEPAAAVSDVSESTGRTTQRDRAYEVIRREILIGRLKSGVRINQRTLAEKLGTSRVPVCEALLRLRGEGLISRSGNWGLKVTEFSKEQAHYHREYRLAIECAAVLLAAQRITPAQIDRLQEEIDKQEILAHAQDNEAFCESDITFHHLILKATSNPYFVRASRSHALGAIATTGEVYPRAVKEHQGILDALAAGRGNDAEAIVRNHLTPRKERSGDTVPFYVSHE